MTTRKLLILTYYFPPCSAVASHRLLGLARHLPEFGWETVVVAPPRVPWEPEDAALLDRVPDATQVVRVPFAGGLMGKVCRRFVPLAHWLPKAWWACRDAIRTHRPDAILTSSPPGCVHVVGLALKRQYRLPWLVDLRDPWFANLQLDRLGLRFRLERFFEKRAMRQADAVIANTPLNLHGLQAAYPHAADKMLVVTNGFDPEAFPDAAPAPPGDRPLTLLHAGELYAGRDPRPLLDALHDLPDVRLHLLGRSTENRCDLETEIARRELAGRVVLGGQVAYSEALDQMTRTDILLLMHSPGLRVGVPAKLYEYLGARRPILALTEPEGDIAWALRTSGVLHRIAPPLDAPRIRQALAELCREVVRGAPVVPDAAALEKFTCAHMARRFAERLDACTAPAAHPEKLQAVSA